MRALLSVPVLAASLALIPASAQASTICHGPNPPGSFPGISTIHLDHASCREGQLIGRSIQVYWHQHANDSGSHFPRKIGNFTMTYKMHNNSDGDEYFVATATYRDSRITMDLSS